MAYKAPIWEDGKSPAISAENLNNLSQAAECAQVLYGNSAPTSSTKGAVGQFYLVVVADSDGNYPLYQCVAIANGSYVWRDTRRIPDSITSMLGIPAPGTINRALNVLANVGNLHVWERVQTYSEPVPEVLAGYTLGAVETDVLLVSKAGETSVSISYSDSISVDANGNVSLASVNTISYVISEWREHYSVLQGKFCQVMDSTSGGITDAGASIFFFPSDAILEYAQAANYKLTLTAKKYQSVTGYPYTPAIPAGTTTDYLTSTDRNAYPDKSAEGGQDAYYTLGDVVIGSFVSGGQKDETYGTWSYGSELSVSSDGALSLSGTTGTVSTGYGSGSISSVITKLSVLKGKFAQLTTNRSGLTIPTGVILFIPTDVTITNELYGDGVNNKVIFNKYQPVTGHAAIPANTTITYLGQLGGGARIEVGSYVGTGTQGSANPTSLTFNFVPKMVIVTKQGQYGFALDGTFSSYSLFWIPGITYFNPGGSGSSSYADAQKNKITLSGKTLSWYRDSTSSNGNASHQLNESGKTYQWVALG